MVSQQGHDMLYQENRVYSEYGAQHESLWEEQEQPLQRPAERSQPFPSSVLASQELSNLRSTPIAIVRPSGTRGNDGLGFETDDDDDSATDVVERDARRLRRKYGDKVVLTAASYQPESTTKDKATSSILKAPYLGSLSKSENFLMSLPPISLSDKDSNVYRYNEDPPAEITSYGSLRESHQRGKFMDGPSSYREPRSGQIRRLDHRGRPPAGAGAGLSQSLQHNSLSIGERIQAAQKRRENEKQKQDETDAAGTSTLSMMLNGSSHNPDSPEEEATTSELEQFIIPPSTIAGVTPYQRSAFGDEDAEEYDKYDPPTMMSTSMTAFEILHTSQEAMGFQRNNHTQRFVQRKQEQYVTSSNSNNSALPSEAEIRGQRFQPLSRSLSDPTPHHLQHSPMLSPTLQQQLNPPTTALPGTGFNSAPVGATPGTTVATAYWPQQSYDMVDPSATLAQHAALSNGTPTPGQIHNPDTDGAFDMDME
jgi:hypothetical protein